MKQALFIAGPTASGKSALSLRLASTLGGVIINADSMQVYDGLRVLTACPNEEEENAAPHRLYRFLDAAAPCSTALWVKHAMIEITSAWEKDQTPILVGGTGMYFKALLDGMAEIPAIDGAIRQAVRDECAAKGSEFLHAELQTYDGDAAKRLPSGDSQRISRAVEVYRSTGKALTEWHKATKPGPMAEFDEAGGVHKIIVGGHTREALYARCDQRFDWMVEHGALEEVKGLMARGLDPQLPSMRSLGVPSLVAYLKGDSSLDEAGDEAKMLTRRFAKRQLTWFRNQFPTWERVSAQLSESEYPKIFT
ncbi:MAG: tRNA (adenosine(37)-N6)-dimethylallyltransferase MiaA [Kordiimonadales bacterium]|nr:MAG: tRNA (adenosine(37)-N6)-dimethylallyltransferase MiaA [Kordiimonadales bacterium]